MKKKAVNKLKINSLLLDRYQINSNARLRQVRQDNKTINIFIYEATDTRLDMPLTILQCPADTNIDTVNEMLNATDSDSNSNNGIYDYFEHDESMWYITGHSFSSLIRQPGSSPLSKPSLFGNRFAPIITVAVVLVMAAVSVLLSRRPDSSAPSNNQPVELTSDSDVSISEVSDDALSDMYMYDDTEYYRVVLYPSQEISSEEYAHDIDILRQRFVALCGDEPYEFRVFDNNICVLVPIGAVESLNALNYLCEYYIAPQFELFISHPYSYENERYYPAKALSYTDLENVSIDNYGVSDYALTAYNTALTQLNQEKEFAYSTSYPCVSFKLSQNYVNQNNEKLYTGNNFIAGSNQSNFSVGVMVNDCHYQFHLIDIATNQYSIFCPQMYLFDDQKYTQNALQLLKTDLTLDKLSSSYYYSITSTEINWLDTATTSYCGSNQCDISDFSGDYCYSVFHMDSEISQGQLLDLSKFLCNLMDSLNVPYALGYKNDVSHQNNNTVSYIYIATGYEHMGIPIANLIANTTNYSPFYLFDGYNKISFSSIASFNTSSSLAQDHELSLTISKDYVEIINSFIENAKSKGRSSLYVMVDDSLLFKTDNLELSSSSELTFDQLAISEESVDWQWGFASAIVDSSDYRNSFDFDGFELMPSDMDIYALSDMFEIHSPELPPDLLEKVQSVCPGASVSYDYKFSNSRFVQDPGRIYVDLNLDVNDTFVSDSLSMVKAVTNSFDFFNNPEWSLITFRLTEEDSSEQEKAKLTLFKKYPVLNSSAFSLGSINTSDMSFDDIMGSSISIIYDTLKLNYASISLFNDELLGEYQTACLICNGRMDSYAEEFQQSLPQDEWFKPETSADTWLWTSTYYPAEIDFYMIN